jgi:hypothetical protein
MGSSKKVTVGFRYYMGLHFGICHGPVDYVREVKAGDRRAWLGNVTDNASVSVSAPSLFGGDEKEGGIEGTLDFAMGGVAQAANSYLQSKIGAVPAFRGILGAIWRGGQVSANNPYIKPWSFRLQRISQGWTTPVFLPLKAPVPIGTEAGDGPLPVLLLANFDSTIADAVSPPATAETINAGASLSPPNQINLSLSSFLRYTDQTGAGGRKLAFINSRGTTFEWFVRGFIYDPDGGYGTPSDPWEEVGAWHFGSGQQIAAIEHNYITRRIRGRLRNTPTGFNQVTAELGEVTGHYAIQYQNNIFSFHVNGQNIGQITLNLATSEADTSFVRFHFLYPGNLGPVFTNFTTIIGAIRFTADRLYPLTTFTPPTGPRLETFQSNVPGAFINYGMNPAHIVYECLTNSAWGMGYPTTSIDADTFTAAADALFAENFGLCLIWNRQDTLESFIQIVLDHAGGILYVDPTTGKFALKLIRADYDRNTLPIFGPSNLVAVNDFQRQAWGETTNELTVVYRDYQTNKDTSVTVQDLANIQTQGAVVSATRQYPGIPNASLAQRVAQRDLNSISTPLARARITANRSAWNLIPGGLFRLTWPEVDVDDVVFRVLEVNRGTLQNGTITIDAVEDVFGLPDNTYIIDQPGEWVDPSTEPAPAPYRKLLEAPYWDLALTLTAAEMDYLDDLSGYVQTLAARPSGDALSYEIQSRVGVAAYAERAAGQFCPTATLAVAINKTATVINLADATDVDLVAPGGYGLIGNEYVGIVSVNALANTATVTRGVLDTVPADHGIGERVWFADGFQGVDPTEYANTEAVDVKLLPRTGLGELAIELAPVDTLTMARRHNRPYPPGNFRINTAAYPAQIVDDLVLTATWAHRDRLTQTAYLVAQNEGNIGPEAGTTYNVQLWNHETNTLIEQFTGVAGTSQAFTALASGIYTLRFELWSVRGGLASYQKHVHVFEYINASVLITEDGDQLITEDGNNIELE